MESLEGALHQMLDREARVRLGGENGANGLAQLVMTLIKLVHELLERQAIRRLDGGSLSDEEAERVGSVLMEQAAEIRRLCVHFGLKESDLHLDLGPLGRI